MKKTFREIEMKEMTFYSRRPCNNSFEIKILMFLEFPVTKKKKVNGMLLD